MTATATQPAPAPAVPSYRVALLRLAASEVDALAVFALDLGHRVTPEAATDGAPRYTIVSESGKVAVLTLAGHDAPSPTLMWAHPRRSTGMRPRDALLAMRLATSSPNGGPS